MRPMKPKNRNRDIIVRKSEAKPTELAAYLEQKDRRKYFEKFLATRREKEAQAAHDQTRLNRESRKDETSPKEKFAGEIGRELAAKFRSLRNA